MINNKEEFINSDIKNDPNLKSNYVVGDSLNDTVIIGSTIVNDFIYLDLSHEKTNLNLNTSFGVGIVIIYNK